MSASYYVYTEVKIKDKWKCVNQYLPVKMEGSDKKKWKLIPTYENHSRTYFDATFNELRDVGEGKPSDISSAILEDQFLDDCYIISADLKDIEKRLPIGKQKQYCGIYHKNDILQFELFELDDLYGREVNSKEYAKMSQDMRDKCYQYFEWDDPCSWFKHFKTIVERSRYLVGEWLNYNEIYDRDYEIRIICFCY